MNSIDLSQQDSEDRSFRDEARLAFAEWIATHGTDILHHRVLPPRRQNQLSGDEVLDVVLSGGTLRCVFPSTLLCEFFREAAAVDIHYNSDRLTGILLLRNLSTCTFVLADSYRAFYGGQSQTCFEDECRRLSQAAKIAACNWVECRGEHSVAEQAPDYDTTVEPTFLAFLKSGESFIRYIAPWAARLDKKVEVKMIHTILDKLISSKAASISARPRSYLVVDCIAKRQELVSEYTICFKDESEFFLVGNLEDLRNKWRLGYLEAGILIRIIHSMLRVTELSNPNRWDELYSTLLKMNETVEQNHLHDSSLSKHEPNCPPMLVLDNMVDELIQILNSK